MEVEPYPERAPFLNLGIWQTTFSHCSRGRVRAMAMMVSVACCRPLVEGFSSSLPSAAAGGKERQSSVRSLQLRRRDFQPLRLSYLGFATRETRNRQGQCSRAGAAFASMRDARELVQSGVVRPIPAAEASGLLSEGGYTLLDVRPIWEREKAFVPGSYHIPLFVEDTSTGPLSLLKKGIQNGQGGWWLGLKLTTRNEQFVEQVQAAFPPGQKLLVACGEGLRSLLALEELNDAGFEQLAWLAGGFNTVRDTDFPKVEGPTKLRFAAVGGVSQYVLKLAQFISGLTEGKESLDSP